MFYRKIKMIHKIINIISYLISFEIEVDTAYLSNYDIFYTIIILYFNSNFTHPLQ